MSNISDFAALQAQYNAKIDSSLSALSSDIDALNAKIAALQASSAPVSPEDQAALDSIQAHSLSVADKLAALDNLNRPVVPASPAK